MILEANDFNSLYIVALIAIALGIILMILTGFIHVKKGYIAIIEKLGVYHGTYKPGFHYFAPFVYRRVGMYKNSPSEIELTINATIIRIKIVVLDFKKYHYATKSFMDIVNTLKSKNYSTIEIFINELQDELINIGCSLIK